jgi:hypothetical protein
VLDVRPVAHLAKPAPARRLSRHVKRAENVTIDRYPLYQLLFHAVTVNESLATEPLLEKRHGRHRWPLVIAVKRPVVARQRRPVAPAITVRPSDAVVPFSRPAEEIVLLLPEFWTALL